MLTNPEDLFDQQIKKLLSLDYPKLAKLSEKEFVDSLSSLKALIPHDLSALDLDSGKLPFVVVVKSDLVPTEKSMELINREGKHGITKLDPLAPNDFKTIEDIQIPESPFYLLVDIDRGKESLNVRPQDALISINSANRSPLTIDEGVAIVTQFPDFLKKNNCFSLLASRHSGDKRVPAIWINGQKSPNLGWCWDGNPHTWLGSASCKARISS